VDPPALVEFAAAGDRRVPRVVRAAAGEPAGACPLRTFPLYDEGEQHAIPAR
jgi:hypothetical protein